MKNKPSRYVRGSPGLRGSCLAQIAGPRGTCTILLRPAQKKIVAITIAMPGIPDAQRGPSAPFASIHGQMIEEMNDPALIEK
jgi:hypothetical protein